MIINNIIIKKEKETEKDAFEGKFDERTIIKYICYSNILHIIICRMFHCTFCKNRDSSDLTYLTHTVRNEKGDTICPYLLKNICDFCGERGHTRMHCVVTQMSKLTTGSKKNDNIHIATKCMMAMDEYIEDNVALTGDELMKGAIESCAQTYKSEMAKSSTHHGNYNKSFQNLNCEFCGRNGHVASYCWIKNRYNMVSTCTKNEDVIVEFEDHDEASDMVD
jgi:hypothetical protein